MEKGGDFGELEVLFTGGLVLTALEMSHGFGGDFVLTHSIAHGLGGPEIAI